MVAVSINDVFQHGSGGDFFIKDITGNSIKTIYFDVTIGAMEDYTVAGYGLDFTRYFTKLVSAEVTNTTIEVGEYVPRVDLASTDGNATLLIVNTTAAEVIAPTTESDDVEDEIQGETVTVRVVGY